MSKNTYQRIVVIGLIREEEAGRTGERGTCWLQPDRSAAFYTMRRPLEQTA
ncbi:MAG: hypothetical protein ACLPTZ_28950 [Beijerinckiaceae bacterium]|jgi:hypothetical protein